MRKAHKDVPPQLRVNFTGTPFRFTWSRENTSSVPGCENFSLLVVHGVDGWERTGGFELRIEETRRYFHAMNNKFSEFSLNSKRRRPLRFLTRARLLRIWIGLPCIGALTFWMGQSDYKRNENIYDRAVVEPHFYMTGSLSRPDARGRILELQNPERTERVFCNLESVQSGCISGLIEPLKVRATLFKYYFGGSVYPVIIQIDDPKGEVILSRKDQMRSLKYVQSLARKKDPLAESIGGAIFGMILSSLTTIIFIFFGWISTIKGMERPLSAAASDHRNGNK